MAKTKAQLIQQLIELANTHDRLGNTNIGNDIRQLVQDINSGKRDHTKVKINAHIKIEKFNGEKVLPDQEPDEIEEFNTVL